MNDETVIIYCEEQRFAAWLRWLVYISMATAVIISIISLHKEFGTANSMNTPAFILAIFTGICIPIAIAALFVLLMLETEVRSDGIYVRFSPFHIHFKRFAPEDLSEFYARQYKPIMEYGGWGIRFGLFGKGKAYNVSGNKGVQLIFKNGKKLLIGSQRAEELEVAIRSITL